MRATSMRYLSPFLSILVLLSPGAMAAQRTFVSGSGSDANPCSITFPCRSFAAALAQTVASPYGGGSASLIRASNSTLFKNNGGVGAYAGSTTVSFGNNRIYDNGPNYGDGGFNTTVTPY